MKEVLIELCAISVQIGKVNVLFSSPVYPCCRVIICPLCYLTAINKIYIETRIEANANFGKNSHKEHSCETLMESDDWPKRSKHLIIFT